MKKILLTVFACMLCLAVFCGCQPKITVENALELYDQAIAEIKQEQSAFWTDAVSYTHLMCIRDRHR